MKEKWLPESFLFNDSFHSHGSASKSWSQSIQQQVTRMIQIHPLEVTNV